MSCSTIASECAITSRGIWLAGTPSNRISPPVGRYRPATSLAMVDLPDPLPPTSAMRWPGCRVNDSPSISGGITAL